MRTKILDGLQVLRAIAALLVVLWHSHLSTKNVANNYWPEGDRAFLAANFPHYLNHLYLGVDIFFCISGFIMYMLIKNNPSVLNSGLKFATARAIRILPPYWFFSSLVILVFLVTNGHLNVGQLYTDGTSNTSRYLTSILLIPQPTPPILGVGWTLIHEFLFYLVCSIALSLGFGQRLPTILLAISIISIIFKVLRIEVLYGYLFNTYAIEFFCGTLAYKISSRSNRLSKTALVLSTATYFLISKALDNEELVEFYFLIRPIGCGLMGFMLIYGLTGIDKQHSLATTKIGKLMIIIGNSSYTLYLSHWFTLSAMGKIIGLIPNTPMIGVVAWHILSIILSITIAVIFSSKVEIPLHKKISRWLESRSKPSQIDHQKT